MGEDSAMLGQQRGPVGKSSRGHGHWVERERKMCRERATDPITLIGVMHITWSRRGGVGGGTGRSVGMMRRKRAPH